MQRSKLKIGQKVLVIPVHTNKRKPVPEPITMYVRELNKGECAGLSHTPKSKHIYGILYKIIHPHPGITKVKLEFEVWNNRFKEFADFIQGVRPFIVKKEISKQAVNFTLKPKD